MSYFLGVDIGTTSVKTVAFSESGEVLLTSDRSYQMLHPQYNWSEQNPDEVLKGVIDTMNNVLSKLLPQQPVLVSFSAMMHSLLVVNEEGKQMTNCMIWADNRASCVAEHLKTTPLGLSFYHASGVPIHAMSPLCKILWIKEHQPEVFNSAHKFIGIKEYVFYKLFGKYVVDSGIASTTGYLNLQSLQWDESVLEHIGIVKHQLSTVVDVKTKYYYTIQDGSAVHPLSLAADIPVIIGSSDGALANIGTGAINNDSMTITIGTSSAARVLTTKPHTDEQMRTFCYHVKDNCYITGGASNNGAVVMQWLKDTLLQTSESYSDLFEQAELIPAGSDDLVFLPFILGERAPIWNSYAKGNFFGFTINHTKAHLIRAVLEGIVYCLYSIGQVIEEKNDIVQLYATGGFALSSLWLQVVADMFNKKLIVSDAKESSALGAVMLGMEAMGINPHIKRQNLIVYEPNERQHEAYIKQFRKFERLYEQVKIEFAA